MSRMLNISDQFVPWSASVEDCLPILERASIKVCLVVNSVGELERTITDGDIRRALLSGLGMKLPIALLPRKKPIHLLETSDSFAILGALEKNDVDFVVLCDVTKRPVNIVERKSFQSEILLSPPHIGEQELNFVKQAFEDNWIAPAGPHLQQFELKLAKYVGRAHALALSSGTAALHLALRVLDIGRGDRVYLSDLTFAASLQPILYEGATPILIDSEPIGWNMSPQALRIQLEKDHCSGTLPAVIFVAHIYGQTANMNEITKLAELYGIPIVEDAAESLGGEYGGRHSGSHGILSAYSFNGNKIITTSGGGALVSDNADLISKARKLSTQGRDDAPHYQHSSIAYNYRMSNVLAGIGVGQLNILSQRVSARRKIFDFYRSELCKIPGISFQENLENEHGNRWLTVVQFDSSLISIHPYQIMKRLKQKGIETRPAWKPMHMQPLCDGFELATHSAEEIVSARLFLTSLCLPSGSSMDQLDQARVVKNLHKIITEG